MRGRRTTRSRPLAVCGREARGGLVPCLPSALGGVSGRNARVRGGRTARSRPLAVCGPGGACRAGPVPPVRPGRERAECQGAWRADRAFSPARRLRAGRRGAGLVPRLPSALAVSGRNARVRGGRTARPRPLADATEVSGRNARARQPCAARLRPLAVGSAGGRRTGGAWWLVPRLPSASCVSGRNARGRRGRTTCSRPLADAPEASGRNARARLPCAARPRPLADGDPAAGGREGRGGLVPRLPSVPWRERAECEGGWRAIPAFPPARRQGSRRLADGRLVAGRTPCLPSRGW